MHNRIILTKDASKESNDVLLEDNRRKAEKALKKASAFILITTEEMSGDIVISGTSEEVMEMMNGLVKSLTDASKIAWKNFKE